MDYFGKYVQGRSGMSMLRIIIPTGLLTQSRTNFLSHWIAGSFHSPSSQQGSLPKAFQKQTLFAFGFFNAHPLNQASLFRGFALKKPVTL